MAGDDNHEKLPTHIAWALQRRRKGRATFIVPLEIGTGRHYPDGTTRLFLDREPKGGYGSYFAEIILLPRGVKPGTEIKPQRPGEPTDEDGDGAEDSED
jgi:hypothetical protein